MSIRSFAKRQGFATTANFMKSVWEGNTDAFNSIYKRFFVPLAFRAAGIVGSYPEAEDIAANAFLKLYLNRSTLKSPDHIQRFLFIIVRNESINHRYQKAKQRTSHYSSEKICDNEYKLLDQSELNTDWIIDSLYALPSQRQAILFLYFFKNKKTKEISEILNISKQTVLNQKARGIKSIRKRLTQKDIII